MSDVLLIHGSCHGAWCWDLVIPALAAHGVTARAIDLPGRGGGAVTLADQAEAILAALDRPAWVLGHSAAGFAITTAADRDRSRFAGLIYLCAYIPVPGMSMAAMRRAGPHQPLRPAIRLAADRQSFSFDPALARDLLYHDCPEGLATAAIARLCAEPVAPQETAFPGSVAPNLTRHAILCHNDRVIPPDYQQAMTAGLPPHAVSDLATGHSPFLAAPDLLARRIADIMRRTEGSGRSGETASGVAFRDDPAPKPV